MSGTGRQAPDWADNVHSVPLTRLSSSAMGQLAKQRGLGFDHRELARIRAYFRRLGREPTDVELAGLDQSWSEHCSYKSSRPFLRRAFGTLHPRPRVLGTGDAGVVRFGPGTAYALRIESHNHPSAVEPYGGAATGIGGILRDVLAVGAKPVALSDPLFFGPLDLPLDRTPAGVKSPRYLMNGVVAGIRDYGNRVGVPTLTGGIYFDPAYVVNPLVNVGCIGMLPTARLRPNRAQRAGNRLVLVGGLTGRDGIGGVAFASRELTDRSESESRGAVQLGNPIVKEPLIRACVEAFDAGLVTSLKDLGGGGIATASGELVHSGGFGSHIDLARVPLREPGLQPWEVWVSESQERMILEVRPAHVPALLGIFERRDVPATDVGEVVSGSNELIDWNGRPAARMDVGFRVDPPPVHRPVRPRARPRRAPPPPPSDRLESIVNELVLAPDSVSREPVIRLYEQDVQGHTAIRSLTGRVTSPTHGDAAVIRPDPGSTRGLALTTAASPWACREAPKEGAIGVVAEAARNLYAVGARPDAFTNCLNFGNPEDPRVLYDFSEVTRGLADGARALGFVVPSGNVSFYNGGLGAEIPPTPVLLATGIVDDIARATTSDLKQEGNPLYLLGRSAAELGGSLWARRHGLTGISVPRSEPRRLRTLGDRLLRAGRAGLVRAVHDVSEGGLAATLCEMAFGGGCGFTADLDSTGLRPAGLALAAEGSSRFVVEVDAKAADRFERMFRGLDARRLGVVTESGGVFQGAGAMPETIDLDRLYARWRTGLASV